jgi:hypothetical protein
MTATAHPVSSAHRLVIALIAAVVSVALTVALVIALTTAGSSSPVSHPAALRTPAVVESGLVGTVNSGPDNPSRGSSGLCAEFAHATPGSPAYFRLADTITAQRSC